MYYVYILQSEKNGSFYTGFTKDVYKRLVQHNEGKVKSTKFVRPFIVVYSKAYQNATEARRQEYYIKYQKSRKFIEQLITGRAVSSVGKSTALTSQGSLVRVQYRPPCF